MVYVTGPVLLPRPSLTETWNEIGVPAGVTVVGVPPMVSVLLPLLSAFCRLSEGSPVTVKT